MLVLSRKVGEQICIGGEIRVTVLAIQGSRVRLGFAGPSEVSIHREEVRRRIAAGSAGPDAARPHEPPDGA